MVVERPLLLLLLNEGGGWLNEYKVGGNCVMGQTLRRFTQAFFGIRSGRMGISAFFGIAEGVSLCILCPWMDGLGNVGMLNGQTDGQTNGWDLCRYGHRRRCPMSMNGLSNE